MALTGSTFNVRSGGMVSGKVCVTIFYCHARSRKGIKITFFLSIVTNDHKIVEKGGKIQNEIEVTLTKHLELWTLL